MMTIEGPTRVPLPRHRVCSWMASWYLATGRGDWAAGYIGELMTFAADGARQGES